LVTLSAVGFNQSLLNLGEMTQFLKIESVPEKRTVLLGKCIVVDF
jgi:hypothetical protein